MYLPTHATDTHFWHTYAYMTQMIRLQSHTYDEYWPPVVGTKIEMCQNTCISIGDSQYYK